MPRLQAMDGVVSTVNGKQTILYPIDAAAPAALTEVVRTIALRRELPNDSIDSNGAIVENGNSIKIRPTNVTAVLYIEYTGGVDGDGNRIPNDYDEIILLQNGPKGGFNQLPTQLDVSNTDQFPNGHTTRRLLVNGVVESVHVTR